MSSVIVIEQAMLKSKAYLSIKTANSIRVLFEFLRRRQFQKVKDRKHGARYVMTNNGQIELTYDHAEKYLGLAQTTFSRCLSELVLLGFIDIARESCGLRKEKTKFSISDRWRLYGTEQFQVVIRKKHRPPFVRKKKNSATTGGGQKQ